MSTERGPEQPMMAQARRLRAALAEVLAEELGRGETPRQPDLLEAELVLEPGKRETQPKSVPLQAVLHKLVLVRERLRLMEQTVNSAAGLDDLARLKVQARLTAVQESVVALARMLTS